MRAATTCRSRPWDFSYKIALTYARQSPEATYYSGRQTFDVSGFLCYVGPFIVIGDAAWTRDHGEPVRHQEQGS